MSASAKLIWIKTEKQWVYTCTYTTCPEFSPDYKKSAPYCKAFPLLLLHASALLWSGTRFPELLVLVFLPSVCKCTSTSIRNKPQEKKKSNTRLILKSADNVSMETKCYGIDNEFFSCAFPSRKKKNQQQTTSKWLQPAVELCYWFEKTFLYPTSILLQLC